MIKIIIPLIFTFGLMGCNPSTELPDYFGQSLPDSIPVVFAQGTISKEGRLEQGLSFSPDGKELAFGVLDSDDFKGTLYYSTKEKKNWSEIVIPNFIGEGSFFLPYFTPDGKSMLFAKSISDTIFDYSDIWIVSKSNGVYGKPQRLKEPLSSFTRDANASMTLDGTIYLASNRSCSDGQCPADIYCCRQYKGEYIDCNRVETISSANDEESVFISPAEDYIITCRYTNEITWMDLYISYRNIENKWVKPQIVDAMINSTNWDRRPFVSIDNKYLFFTRLQIGERGLTESDIYWVNTTKLFKPYVYNPLSSIILKVGEKFELPIPVNYFKDIDDKQLTLSTNQKELDWLAFNSKNMRLTGLPTHEGNFELIFTAVDNSSNITTDKIKITVIE